MVVIQQTHQDREAPYNVPTLLDGTGAEMNYLIKIL